MSAAVLAFAGKNMPLPELTKGFFQHFFNNHHLDKPILQILECKLLMDKQHPERDDRYRMRLSDGEFSHSTCMTQSHLKEQIIGDKLDSGNAVIRLTHYTATQLGRTMENKTRLSVVISSYELVDRNSPKIGNPIAHSGNTTQPPPPPSVSISDSPLRIPPIINVQRQSTNAAATMQPVLYQKLERPLSQNIQARNRNESAIVNRNDARNLTPISALTPYVMNWRICGVVVAKEDNLRKVPTEKYGDVDVFSWDMSDGVGDVVRVSAWHKQATKFFPQIAMNNTYYLSKCMVKPAAKRFNNTGHDYELSTKADTELERCIDSNQILNRQIKYKLIKFDRLDEHYGSMTDVIGILERAEDVSQVTVKKTNEPADKRDLHLFDDTGSSVVLTLWGDRATKFHIESGEHPIIGFTGIMVKEFQGVALATTARTIMTISPNCPEAFELAEWYASQGGNVQVKSLSRTPASGSNARMDDLWLIAVADLKQIGQEDEKGAYFNVSAMVTSIKTENILYKACPEAKCQKKVINKNDQYHCDKCNKTFNKFKYVLMLSAELADTSGAHSVMLFGEVAEKMIGADASTLGSLLENDPSGYKNTLTAVLYKSFVFRIRSKLEMFNDDPHLKWTVFSVRPVELDAYRKALETAIEAMQQRKQI